MGRAYVRADSSSLLHLSHPIHPWGGNLGGACAGAQSEQELRRLINLSGENIKTMKRFFIHSKGQVIVMYAGLVAALLGAAALCADVAVMYVNSIQLQKAVDSAAIAGATYLTGIAFSGTAASGCTTANGYSDDAKKAACTYAYNNGIDPSIDGISLNVTEPTSTTLTVTARHSGLPYFFGKAIGLSSYNVSVSSTGQASLAVGTVKLGMFPVGLQCTAPCNLSNLDPGQSVNFGQKFVGGLAPGNWQFLAISGTGDSVLGTNINNGSTGSYTIGSSLNSEPGNKGNSSNVQGGLASRLARCHSIADPCSASGGNPSDIPAGDACLVVVPAVDYHGCTGSCSITVEGFALIYLEAATTTGTSINGCFVKAVAADTITASGAPQLGAEMPPILIQ